MGVAERPNLERDLRVYVASIARVLNAWVLPYDFRETVAELAEQMVTYVKFSEGYLDLSRAEDELKELSAALDDLYARISLSDAGSDEACILNNLFIELARILVPIGYAEGGSFDHDPALPRMPIPRLARIRELEQTAVEFSDQLPFLVNELGREVNYVANGFYEAVQAVRRVGNKMTPAHKSR